MTIDSRIKDVGEQVSRLLKVGLWRKHSTPVSTTLNGALAVGDTVVTVADASSLSAGDIIAVDVGNLMEIMEIASIATNDITPVSEVKRAHLTGVAVQKAEDVDLGNTTTEGFRDRLSIAGTLRHVGTQYRPYNFIPGHHETPVELEVEEFTLDNWLYALGLDESTHGGGSGTAADPSFLFRDPDALVRALKDSAAAIQGRYPGIYVEGEYQESGDKVRIEYWSFKPGDGDYGFALATAGDPPVVPFRGYWFSGSPLYRWTP